jgi:hypothetical protein
MEVDANMEDPAFAEAVAVAAGRFEDLTAA